MFQLASFICQGAQGQATCSLTWQCLHWLVAHKQNVKRFICVPESEGVPAGIMPFKELQWLQVLYLLNINALHKDCANRMTTLIHNVG